MECAEPELLGVLQILWSSRHRSAFVCIDSPASLPSRAHIGAPNVLVATTESPQQRDEGGLVATSDAYEVLDCKEVLLDDKCGDIGGKSVTLSGSISEFLVLRFLPQVFDPVRLTPPLSCAVLLRADLTAARRPPRQTRRGWSELRLA